MSIAEPVAVSVEVELARSDVDLVARFVAVKDEAAYAELVRRHSGLVMGVCRRVLRDAHDIEDVFQATFLVFVRDAARVRKQASLASWLYGVAYRLAVRVAQQKQRRRETLLVDETATGDDALTELADRYDQQLVDAELNALPERYRRPLVLKYLAEKSPRDIAIELGITVGAVEGLLKRGKDELRTRLMRRGVTLGTILVAVQLTQQSVQAACTETLIEATVHTGLAWNSANLTSSLDPVSDRVLELSGKELATMTTLTKAGLTIGLTVGALALGLGGAGFLVNQSQSPGRADAGIVSTLPANRTSARGVETVAFADEKPIAKEEGKPGVPVPVTGQAKRVEADARTQPHVTNIDDFEAAPRMPAAAATRSAAASTWDFKPRSPAVVKIELAMTEPTEIAFNDVPLSDAVESLNDHHKLSIIIDRAALQEEGLASDLPITLTISEVSLRSGLNLILEPLNLDYVIKNEVLLITTKARAEVMMETRVYNVARIPQLTPKELAEIIAGDNGDQGQGAGGLGGGAGGGGGTGIGNASLIPNAKWETRDGEGGTAWAGKTTLIIRQNQRVHQAIVELLDQLAVEQPAPTKSTTELK